ncbi:hypothetical protein NBO_353g0008 [Nosema bombycis CQ1]|uniref:Uncharacterized protein n=1 Tax=Nosema bombycis (strain CQ1 / CVCC 102059) TaxID=578461 RepID=R0KRM8_NOSB1|nr:hypothetical protein NBO_353g0008 [Nosema bombycis CQ1]|eukprot:EOB12867.1 hypothetical protein NBO_353g0008 [Nosema bombycis CQ1]
MGNLKNLFEDSKKLAKLDKRTRKSLLKTINDLDHDKKMTLIIFFTEFEPKTKEYRKFWRITKERYTVEDIFKASCFLNLYKICPKKEVIKTLSQSKKGLEDISKIYQNYNFLTGNENLKLLKLCHENGVKNVYLEKFNKKMVYKNQLMDALDVLNKIDVVDENILQSCTSEVILEYLKSKSCKGLKSAKDVLLVRNMVYLLFEEKNYEFLSNFSKENKEMLFDVFGKNRDFFEGFGL